jgi:hypothetical protein
VLLLVLVGGTLAILRSVGLLDVDGEDEAGTRFTATLTFVGVLATGAVAFVGHAVTRQGEARQAVDSSVRAIELLVKPDGSPTGPLAAGAGLLALANLGQTALAIALLSDLWGHDRVSREAAVELVDRALASGPQSVQIDAAYVLHTNSDKLWDPKPPAERARRPSALGMTRAQRFANMVLIQLRSSGSRLAAREATYTIPNYICFRWDDSLPFVAKERLVESWVYVWTTAPNTVDYALKNLLFGLNEYWRSETTPAIRNSIGCLIEALLTAPGLDLPMTAWVSGKRRVIGDNLVAEVQRWRRWRRWRKREVAGIVELCDSVRGLAARHVTHHV